MAKRSKSLPSFSDHCAPYPYLAVTVGGPAPGMDVSDAEWIEENSVGDALMDTHHHRFFQTVAQIEEGSNSDAPSLVGERLAFLRAYVDMHFDAEEALLEEIGFAGLDAHRAAPQAFRVRLQGMHAELGDRVDPAQAQSMRNRLRYWWITHIQREDAQYAPLLKPRR